MWPGCKLFIVFIMLNKHNFQVFFFFSFGIFQGAASFADESQKQA